MKIYVVITNFRNYGSKLLRVSRSYDVEVHTNHEITHFRIITAKNLRFYENFVTFYEFYK
jgi:hypothetical protein